ncbi:MAG: nitroreductase family deazaflavin-dependent oxidoreductase [Chloroflexi bacterium]|nr:nitroreductase family deazaflavin-dependent oxidoreductase [Chloroflexota bacterium]
MALQRRPRVGDANLDSAIRQALERDRTIDITTIGRNSGQPRRVEIWFHNVGGRIFISGTPGTRSWYANMLADPNITFHLKGSVHADLPAHVRPIVDEAERRQVLPGIFEKIERDLSELDAWVESSPLVEVEFLDSE